ncbi:MAG: DUF5333 domain-containing protein [Thalassovita sp.]
MRLIVTTATALTLALASVVSLNANAAAARAPLNTVAEIDKNMLWVALAIEISDTCGEIAPRTLKGLATLNSLRSRAKALGYSSEEIKAYVQSDVEKARIRTLGEAYVKSKGLNPADSGDLCALGFAEIDRKSQIGVLLKAK